MTTVYLHAEISGSVEFASANLYHSLSYRLPDLCGGLSFICLDYLTLKRIKTTLSFDKLKRNHIIACQTLRLRL